jgi:hypothetical protein
MCSLVGRGCLLAIMNMAISPIISHSNSSNPTAGGIKIIDDSFFARALAFTFEIGGTWSCPFATPPGVGVRFARLWLVSASKAARWCRLHGAYSPSTTAAYRRCRRAPSYKSILGSVSLATWCVLGVGLAKLGDSAEDLVGRPLERIRH